MPAALKYGAVVFAAVFFVGWITGMGGSWLPNLLFSLAVGALATACYVGAQWLAGRQNK